MPYQIVKKCDNTSIHLDTTLTLDGQDREKCRNNIVLCMHCMLICNNHYHYLHQK